MTPAEVSEAARICLQASDPEGLIDATLHRFFATELADLVAEDAVIGVAGGGEGPAVIALGGRDLLVARASVDEDGQLQLASSIVPLWPAPRLELVSLISADRRSRSRRWSLLSVPGDPLELETAETFHADFAADIGPDSGELVMRALAERLGVAGEGR